MDRFRAPLFIGLDYATGGLRYPHPNCDAPLVGLTRSPVDGHEVRVLPLCDGDEPHLTDLRIARSSSGRAIHVMTTSGAGERPLQVSQEAS